jgi:hypothetical protein
MTYVQQTWFHIIGHKRGDDVMGAVIGKLIGHPANYKLII